MADIIDLSAERDRRDGPDRGLTYIDPRGRKWMTFVVRYKRAGKEFSFHLMALSWKDAERHVEAIRRSGSVDGVVYAEGNL